MSKIRAIDRITGTLRDSDLSWLLPNLRQDPVVWNRLVDPTYFEKFILSKPVGSLFTPADFSPANLALLALDQSNITVIDPKNLLDSINNQVVQMAIRSFDDETLFHADPQDLETAGLIALGLAYNYQATHSWNGLLSTLNGKAYRVWSAPLVCLVGFVDEPVGLFNALVQPGASLPRYKLAIHAILSNPITPNDQMAIFMGLSHGAYGDPLPPTDRLLLVQALFEQRPRAAMDFCSKWLEIHPDFPQPIHLDHKKLVEDINHLAEILFQIEIRKITAKSQDLAGLFEPGNELTHNLYAGLINHFISQKMGNQDEKSSANDLLTVAEKAIQINNLNSSAEKLSTNQSALALTLANHGLVDQASQLLPSAGAPLPADLDILYAIAKLAYQNGDLPRASTVASRMMELLNAETTVADIAVWGENFSLSNLGKLLFDLHKYNDASHVFAHALQTCPNDAGLLKSLALSQKSSHQDQSASETLRVLVSLHPANLDERRLFAQSLEDVADWEAALHERSNIIEASPVDSETSPNGDRYAYAHCALNASHPELTIKVCNDILTENQDDDQALIYIGKACLMMNESEKGMEYLVRATQVSPNSSEAWLALANAQKQAASKDTVIDTLKNASQAVPDSAQIKYVLGDMYLQDNAPTLALPCLQNAVDLSPDDPQILASYAKSLQLLGHTDESKQVLSKAYSIDPNFPGLAQAYADVLVDLGDLEEAISPLEVLVNSKSSQDVASYLVYARCILTLNKAGSKVHPPMKALIALNQILQVEPAHAEAKALIAEALTASGEYELAFQAYREALDTALTEDNAWSERLSYGFGCVASSIGKHDIAIAALQEAGQVNPNNPAIFVALSDAYLSAALPEDAIRSARNVLVIDGENPDRHAWFANQVAKLLRNQNPDSPSSITALTREVPSEALAALAKAIQLAPTRVDYLVQLGYFQSTIGALDEASTTFTSIASLDFATVNDLKSAAAYLSGIGDHPSAIACLESAIVKDQQAPGAHEPSLYASLAREYVNNNDHSSAISTLDKAIENIPDDHSLISLKIDILLGLGQSIDALSCIEIALQKSSGNQSNIDLIFLASRINRAMGDFSSAIKYARIGAEAAQKSSSTSTIAQIPPQYRLQIAELYRALLQPEVAYQLIQANTVPESSEFTDPQDYLDFICLQTELALEIGEQLSSDIQDLQPDPSNPSFSRLMAIKARLLNKAGNYKQAEQLFQFALEKAHDADPSSGLINWSAPYRKYLDLISLHSTALDLGLWDQAHDCAEQVRQSSANEPLSHLILAQEIVAKAEFHNLCEIFVVTNHKPSIDISSPETVDILDQHLADARSSLDTYRDELIINEHAITNSQVYRWQARADVVFNRTGEAHLDPGETLASQLTPGDAAALIVHLHRQDVLDPDGDSLTEIIKIARSYPRNPAVVLSVALALQDNNPADAMRSLRSVLEQNPFSRCPTIAFCNILVAKIAFGLDEYELAQHAAENALEFWQDEPSWHALAARICKHNADIDLATSHFLEAARLAPENAAYQMDLGLSYFENADEDPKVLNLALKAFENALALEPGDVSAHLYLANTQYLLNDLESAEVNAHNALKLAPDRADIYQLLSEIAIASSDFQCANEYANKAVQIDPRDIESSIMLARSLSALGRHKEALSKLNAVIPQVQEARSLHLERVSILREIEGPQAALDELKTLTNSYPDDFHILNALSKSFLEVGETDNAVTIAQQALQSCHDKTSRNDQANLHLMIGQVLRQSGQLDQSIEHLSEAIQLSPNRLEPYIELGLARKERREYQQALQIFERATIIAPDDPRAPYQAGLALKESKDYKSSEMMLRRAVSLAPNDLNIRRQLAAVVALNLVHNPRTGRNYAK